jgi:hypothetical protein
VSDERPLSGWSDRRIAEHGRVICQQRSLPTHPGLAGEQVRVDRPDPRLNGKRAVRPDRPPATPPSDLQPPVAGQVSVLDRVTLQLGVAVAVAIATCSYAVSATSLYALGVQAGYSSWQAAAVPVVADGPAIYGMFRIVSRSRRGAKGAGYGWLLVIAGTLAEAAGCGRSSAASFLQRQRPPAEEHTP